MLVWGGKLKVLLLCHLSRLLFKNNHNSHCQQQADGCIFCIFFSTWCHHFSHVLTDLFCHGLLIHRASLVPQLVKNPPTMRETLVWVLGQEDPLEKGWAAHPSILGLTLVARTVKNPPAMRETWVQSLGWEGPLKKGKATHSSILAWRIPWTIQVHGSQRVRHHWATFTSLYTMAGGLSWGAQHHIEQHRNSCPPGAPETASKPRVTQITIWLQWGQHQRKV